MKQVSYSDRDDLDPPRSQARTATNARFLRIVYRVPVLLVLLVSFSACVDNPDNLCSGSRPTVALLCMASSNSQSIPPAKQWTLTPIPLSPASTPSCLPPPIPLNLEKTATHYLEIVLRGCDVEAYGILSPEVRAREPFSDFKQNWNYTLFQGCWQIDNIFSSQSDSQSGIVSIELTNVSCDDNSPIEYFDWVLRFHLEQGKWVIVSIGLYPTAPGN